MFKAHSLVLIALGLLAAAAILSAVRKDPVGTCGWAGVFLIGCALAVVL